jgi:3-oxoacyl-[acyl-carrier protein] reductase
MQRGNGLLDLSGRVAFITGASHGIGRSTAIVFAQLGADVVVNYRKTEAEALAVAHEIGDLGRRSLVVQADVSDYQAMERAAVHALEAFGHVDLLVNNAGSGAGAQAPLVDTSVEDWQRVLAVNAGGVFNACHALLPSMIGQQYGRIVNVSSIVGKTGRGYVSKTAYAAAKATVIGLTKGVARDGAPFGITANAVCPSWIETHPIGPEMEGLRQRALTEIPLGRLGQPQEVAHLIAFLASDVAAYITGQSININGGLLME